MSDKAVGESHENEIEATAHQRLVELMTEALGWNPYYAYEIGYNRTVGWMVHIWNSRGVGLTNAPKLLSTQDEDINAACEQAITEFKAYLLEQHPDFDHWTELDTAINKHSQTQLISADGWPMYKSHKDVAAFEIGKIEGNVIYPKDEKNQGAVLVKASFFEGKDLNQEGYLVRYKDGYLSFSPKAAFEEGNSPIMIDAKGDQNG